MEFKLTTLTAKDELPISLRIFVPETEQPAPTIIFLPGLKGFKNWGCWPDMSKRICQQGYCVITVDFSCNGVQNDGFDVNQPDLTEKTCFAREIEETNLIIQAIQNGQLPAKDHMDANRIGLIGHSMGGGVALLCAEKNPVVRFVITLASVSRVDFLSQGTIALWKKKGNLEIPNTRTGQTYRLGLDMLDEVLDPDSLNILQATQNLKRPLLIIHGEQDGSTSVECATELYNAADSQFNELFTIEKTGHTFGAQHPYHESTPALDLMIQKICDWLKLTTEN